MNIEVYTDGSFHIKTGIGGWGTLIRYNYDTDFVTNWYDYGGKIGATSSGEMEVIGILKALTDLPNKCNVKIYCDNQYAFKSLVDGGNGELTMILGRVQYTGWIRGWIKNGWKTTKGPVKNQNLWIDVMNQCNRLLKYGSVVNFFWVKGHSNDEYNDIADDLARKGAELY